MMIDLSNYIRDIKDFPKEGIVFKDITPLLKDPAAFKESISEMEKILKGTDFDYIVGPEARGFVFGSALAARMDKGLIPVRKAGKLPAETHQKKYDLEYGSACLEIHKDALDNGDKVIIIDDLLATGGTSLAIAEMVEEMGAVVEKLLFLIELDFLKGRDRLSKYNIESIIHY